MTTLWVVLHVAAQRDYELHSLDFSTAFLQGSLHEEILLRHPLGFTGLFPAGTQWSLWWPVYGLRQAPHEWHDTLRTTLAALGFTPSTADPSLFLRTDTSLPPFYVLVCVDDLVFATADTEILTLVKSKLQKRHTCTDLGELCSYLGLQIAQDRARRTITLTQSHMMHQVLQRFGFLFSSPQPTPLSTSHSLSTPPLDESVEPSGPYPELVGCLMYLMTCTRPDLAYPLSLLACYVAPDRHQKVHWDAAKRVLRYLCSTSGMGLVLGGRGLVVLTGHADASWGKVGDHGPSVQVLVRAGLSVAAALPPLASVAAAPALAVALAAPGVAPPLLSLAAAATAPAAAAGTPDLPSHAIAMTPPLLSPAAAATAPVAAVVTPLLSPTTAATAPAATVVNPPLLSPAAIVTPPLISPSVAMAPPLPSPDASAAAGAAVVPSQIAPAPPSPTGEDAANRSGNMQCTV
ncbi:unnamed protein product [Closterium sp. NIES-54]